MQSPFDDADIREALIEALTRGVALFILTNLEGSTGEVYTNKSSGKKRGAQQTTQDLLHSASIKRLYDAGSPYFPALMVFMLNFF